MDVRTYFNKINLIFMPDFVRVTEGDFLKVYKVLIFVNLGGKNSVQTCQVLASYFVTILDATSDVEPQKTILLQKPNIYVTRISRLQKSSPVHKIREHVLQ